MTIKYKFLARNAMLPMFFGCTPWDLEQMGLLRPGYYKSLEFLTDL